MENIDKLNFSFTDGQTTITAKHLNSFVDRINRLIDAVGGDTPTPTPTVNAPTIYVRDLAVIMTAESGATIRYTTDGSTPTASSTQYTNAFTLSENKTIKAIAVKNGASSSVASANFTYNNATGNDARQPQIVIENKKLICISNGLENSLKYSIDGAAYATYTEPVSLSAACDIKVRTYTTNPGGGNDITKTAGAKFNNNNDTLVTIPQEYGLNSRRIMAADSSDTTIAFKSASNVALAIYPIMSGKSYRMASVNENDASAYYGYINEVPSEIPPEETTVSGKMPSQPTAGSSTLQVINFTAENYPYVACVGKGAHAGGDTYTNNPEGYMFAEVIG